MEPYRFDAYPQMTAPWCSSKETGVVVALQQARAAKRVFTAPAIDLSADTYRSRTLVVLLLVGVMFNYMAYIASTQIRTNNVLECQPLVSLVEVWYC